MFDEKEYGLAMPHAETYEDTAYSGGNPAFRYTVTKIYGMVRH
jgi:hypothetical protein